MLASWDWDENGPTPLVGEGGIATNCHCRAEALRKEVLSKGGSVEGNQYWVQPPSTLPAASHFSSNTWVPIAV